MVVSLEFRNGAISEKGAEVRTAALHRRWGGEERVLALSVIVVDLTDSQ